MELHLFSELLSLFIRSFLSEKPSPGLTEGRILAEGPGFGKFGGRVGEAMSEENN